MDLWGTVSEKRKPHRKIVPDIHSGVSLSFWLNTNLHKGKGDLMGRAENTTVLEKEWLPKKNKLNTCWRSHRAGRHSDQPEWKDFIEYSETRKSPHFRSRAKLAL